MTVYLGHFNSLLTGLSTSSSSPPPALPSPKPTILEIKCSCFLLWLTKASMAIYAQQGTPYSLAALHTHIQGRTSLNSISNLQFHPAHPALPLAPATPTHDVPLKPICWAPESKLFFPLLHETARFFLTLVFILPPLSAKEA